MRGLADVVRNHGVPSAPPKFVSHDTAFHRQIPNFLFGPLWTKLEQRGVSCAELEGLSGLARPTIGRFTEKVTVAQAFRLYDAAIRLTGEEALGLALVSDLGISSLHLFGHVVTASCTLEQAFELLGKLEPRLLEHGLVMERLAAGEARVGQYSHDLATPAERMHAQLTAAFLMKFVGFFCPDAADAVSACFPFSAPPDVVPYRVHFPRGVRFDADGIFVVFPERAVDHVRTDADPLLAEQMRVFASDLYATEGNTDDWTTRVCRTLRAHPAPRTATKSELAKRLGVSTQGLVRGLAHEGVSIAELIDRVLYERAQRLLSTSRASYAEIADALGYVEVSSFFRAFRRWSGTTPHVHRERLRARTRA